MAIGQNVTAIATSASVLAAAAALARSKLLESQLRSKEEELRVVSLENTDLDAATKHHSHMLASVQSAAQEQLEHAFASMGEVLKQKDAQLDASVATANEHRLTIETLRGEVQLLTDAAARLTLQLDESAITIVDLQEQVVTLESTQASAREEIEDVKEERRSAREAEASTLTRLQQTIAKLEIKDAKLKTQSDQIESLTSSIDDASRCAEMVKKDLESKNVSASNTITQLEETVISLEAKDASSKSSIDFLQQEVSKLTSQVGLLQSTEALLTSERERAGAAELALSCLRTESAATIDELNLEVKNLAERAEAVETLEKQLADEKRRASLAKVVLEAKVAQLNEPTPTPVVLTAAEPEPIKASSVDDDEELIRQLEGKESRKGDFNTPQKTKRKSKGSK